MRFPFRLSAGLFKAKIFGLFGGPSATPPIFRFNPCVTGVTQGQQFSEDAALEWHSPEECAARVRMISSPVVWVGGAEPLLHPEIGKAASAIVETDRFVFVHTTGYNLRNRIHEFSPDSRLFLAVEFAGREEAHNRLTGIPDAFRRAMESIRAAKLSGFLVAAHITVKPETDPCDVGELIEFLDKKDVDGFIVTSGGRLAHAENHSLGANLELARTLIRSGRWESFSRLLDASYAEAAPVPQKIAASGENAFEEGD